MSNREKPRDVSRSCIALKSAACIWCSVMTGKHQFSALKPTSVKGRSLNIGKIVSTWMLSSSYSASATMKSPAHQSLMRCSIRAVMPAFSTHIFLARAPDIMNPLPPCAKNFGYLSSLFWIDLPRYRSSSGSIVASQRFRFAQDR